MITEWYQPQKLEEMVKECTAVSPTIKATLQTMIDELGPLLPQLAGLDQYLTAVSLKQLVAEITAETVETHWWEMNLHLLKQATGLLDGQTLSETATQLAPLLHEHFGPQEPVTLQEINVKTVRGICRLSDTLTDPQDMLVAPNALSLAQAHFNKHAWSRAVYSGKTPVGFLLLYDNVEKPEYFLWRYMIDAKYQGRGYGRSALNLLIDYVKTRPGAKELLVSYVPAEGGPEKFYAKLGFVNTGVEHDGEMEMKLTL